MKNLSLLFQLLIVIILVPFLPLLLTGNWRWLEGWLYAILGVFGFILSRILVSKKHPDLLSERAKMTRHENTKKWDKPLSLLLGWGGALLPLVAGLDLRDGWSNAHFGWGWKVAAILIILAGYAFSTWAMVENRFFSGVVRIQSDRGHHVVDGGPYAWVRHPGYAGALWVYFASPLLLDSLCAFGVAAFLALVIFIRTSLEDSTLQTELPGYAEYATRTKYRLIPGIW